MNGSGIFLDTNVLVYAVVGDGAKRAKASTLWQDPATISVQVLNELTNVLRKKHLLAWPEIHDILSIVKDLFDVLPLTEAIHDRGIRLAERHGFAIYDAMIVAAALEAGCQTLYSEDMQHGMVVGSLRIDNPFI